MNQKIKAIVFDFGGTLDTNGIHWAEKFWEVYNYFNISIPKNEFKNSFVYSERKISEIIKPEFSLLKTYKTQIFYQLEYLINNKVLSSIEENLANKLSLYCLGATKSNINVTIKVLEKLKNNYVLGLVSNYYGNVKTVLNELGLDAYFDVVIDSTTVGIRKPDSKIFHHTISELNAKPEEVIVVGDSYKNDITPAKFLGCKTIWLKDKGWTDINSSENADVTIDSLNKLSVAINSLVKINTYRNK